LTIKKLFSIAVLAAVFAEPALAARRPRNPRRRKKVTPAAVSLSSAPAVVDVSSAPPVPKLPEIEIARLPPGRWTPEAKEALEREITRRGKRAPGYDEDKPPAAVLPANDALVYNDAGEIVFRALVDRADFRFGDEFWQLVPLAFGRQALRAAYEQFIDLPVGVWPQQPTYRQYRKGFLSAYQNMCSRTGRAECRAFLARLTRGYTLDEIYTYAQAILREESIEARRPDSIAGGSEVETLVSVRRGYAYVPEMRDLIKLLKAEGWDVWIVDTELQQILEVVAKPVGVPANRVIGIQLVTKDERLTGQVGAAAPIRTGKLELVLGVLGRAPELAVAAKPEDEALLAYGEGLRLVLDRGDERLRKVGEEKQWVFQPALD
jgi:hypothetical protein